MKNLKESIYLLVICVAMIVGIPSLITISHFDPDMIKEYNYIAWVIFAIYLCIAIWQVVRICKYLKKIKPILDVYDDLKKQ